MAEQREQEQRQGERSRTFRDDTPRRKHAEQVGAADRESVEPVTVDVALGGVAEGGLITGSTQ